MTLYYTAASPANAQTLNTSNVDVGNETDGKNNALFPLAQSVMIGKTERIYYFDVVGSSCLPLDVQDGMFSNRAVKNVGNGILYQTKNGVDNLQQKQYSTGSSAIVGEQYSADLQTLTSKITANQWNANCGVYIKELNNYYFSFDTADDNTPDTTLVYSSLIGKTWSQYLYPAIYDYGYYIDTNNRYNYIMCSAVSGIIYKIENGFDDDGVPINYSLETKDFDFKMPFNWKDFEAVSIKGLKNEGSEATIDLLIEDDVVYTATLTDDFITSTSSFATIGSDPIGSQAIGGGGVASTGIDVYPYQIKLGAELFASGQTMRIRITSSANPLVMTVDTFEIKYTNSTEDMFPSINFA
jgi:hypothetical protein